MRFSVRYRLIRRVIALWIDFIIASIPGFLIAVPIYQLFKDSAPKSMTFFIILISNAIFYFIYEVGFLAQDKQTLGRKIAKLNVVFNEGKQANVTRRTLMKLISIYSVAGIFISGLMVNYGNSTTSLHDKVAKSQVEFS